MTTATGFFSVFMLVIRDSRRSSYKGFHQYLLHQKLISRSAAELQGQ